MQRHWLKRLTLPLFGLLVFAAPTLLGGSGAVYSAAVLIAIFAVMAYGLDIIVSDLGEVSLAHTVFFAAGSYTIGRGYDPGVLSGDSGVGFSTELRYDRLGVLARYDIGIQPYGFVDTEWVWNRNTPAGTDPQQVTSLGAGARIGVADKLRLDLAVAVPLRDAGPTRAGDVRVLMSLTARLIPWSAR